MRAVMLMFDSLNRRFLEPYGCDFTHTPNFKRLSKHAVTFNKSYAGSLPCMPARRELHTGRYNFLHKCWGPLEPFDDSMPLILKENGIHTHIVSDHLHYWEDGGANYVTKYSTWECVRGQEGDPWIGQVKAPEVITLEGAISNPYRKKVFKQDTINRQYFKEEKDHPQAKTFKLGMEYIERNKDEDNWFLQIETFDPHEPFFTYDRYKELYPHEYNGPRFDWVDYRPVTETPEQIEHLRCQYFALLSMCDNYLGKLLDMFDELDLWKDTMLIVNTDHGYMLSEHGYWAKNYMPQYNEIANTPLFIWDPRFGIKGETRESLVQTIDLPVYILDYFNLKKTDDMQGKSLTNVIRYDEAIHDGGLFGLHGSHICVTDGRYVYMKAPVKPSGTPLYNYTQCPAGFALFPISVLKTMSISPPFSFTKGTPLMRLDAANDGVVSDENANNYGDLLFDLENDPKQLNPIKDENIEKVMKKLMIKLMKENDCPFEQFERVGLCEGE